jgi:hypothetical protein
MRCVGKSGPIVTLNNNLPKWAPKVSKSKIQRLYTSDASGFLDEELLNDVGWALWSRCDSILTVTAAHYGRVICPTCSGMIVHLLANARHAEEQPGAWHDEDVISCANCGWHMPWTAYHQSYRGKQLFGANAVEFFEKYHKAFPQTLAPNVKMLLIDQLIHAFHLGLTEFGRPVGANLIEGSLKEVIFFLDTLTNGPGSAAGIGNSRDDWRRNLDSIAWAKQFLKPDEDGERKSAN